tara:strand:- start:1739 stop:2062 length:324 start_codon:yes stop_codon:yes gene_type:complete
MSNFLAHPMVKLNQGYTVTKAIRDELIQKIGLEQAYLRRFNITQSVSISDQSRVLKTICEKSDVCSEKCPVFLANQCQKDNCSYKDNGELIQKFISEHAIEEINNLI